MVEFNYFRYLIGPSVFGIATAGLIFEFKVPPTPTQYLFHPLENPNLETFLQTLSAFLYIFCFLSYGVSIYGTKLNNPPSTLVPPRCKTRLPFNHPIYLDRKYCDK